MSTKEKIYLGLGALIIGIAYLFAKDSAASAAIEAFFRRKSVEDLADKIKKNIASLNLNIGFTEARLTEEAVKYRQLQRDESPEGIQKYYHDFLTNPKPPANGKLPYNA